MNNTQPEALRLAELLTADEWPGNMTLVSYARECVAELRRQHARIAELEAQLSSSGFTAADMATAAAQGFRDGVASVAESAGSEPVAVAEVSCTHVHGWGTRWIVDADRKLNIPPLGTKLYARPPAPKQGQKDSSRLRKALIRAQQAINSMKVEAETAAQGDKRMMLEACETISNEGLQADMAIRDVLANHSSPPEGMVGGWISVQDELPKCSKKPDSLGVEVLIWPPHEDGSRTAFYGRRQSREPNFYKYGALLGHVEFWRYPPPPPTTSAGSGKGE